MKPRNISETQRLRALSLGIKPVIAPEVPVHEPSLPETFVTSLGCEVSIVQTKEGTEITLKGGR